MTTSSLTVNTSEGGDLLYYTWSLWLLSMVILPCMSLNLPPEILNPFIPVLPSGATQHIDSFIHDMSFFYCVLFQAKYTHFHPLVFLGFNRHVLSTCKVPFGQWTLSSPQIMSPFIDSLLTCGTCAWKRPVGGGQGEWDCPFLVQTSCSIKTA